MTYYFWKVSEKFGCLSQWYPSKFTDSRGQIFNSAEQFMMYNKAVLFNDTDIAAQILQTSLQNQIKALGRQVRNFDPVIWDKNKFDIVVQGNLYKFTQNKNLLDFLLDTGNNILAEASPYDKIWGIGLSPERAEAGDSWQGENLLGKALMEVRNKLIIENMQSKIANIKRTEIKNEN